MPKKSLPVQARPEPGSGEYVLGPWRAAALSMAVIAPAAWYGLGALLGAAVMIPVIYALARLRRHAPQARSTAELIGATLGRKAGTAAGIVQLLAYLVLAAQFAATLGLQLLQLLSPGDDPAAIVSWLPVVLAGLLLYVCLAVAVTALVTLSTDPVVIGSAATPRPLSGQLVGFGLGMVGVELLTVRTPRIARPGRSMSLATAVVAAAAVVLWVGDHRGVAGPWRWSATMLAEAVPEFYTDEGRRWMARAWRPCAGRHRTRVCDWR